MARYPTSLSPEVYDELAQYICSHAADKYGVDYEQRIAAFRKYDVSLIDTNHYNKKLIPTLYMLPDMLSVAGMTVKDVYDDVWHTPLNWPDQQSADVAAVIDTMGLTHQADVFLDQLCLLIHPFIESWWDSDSKTEQKGKSTNPAFRIKNAYLKKIDLDTRTKLPKNVQDIITGILIQYRCASHLEIPLLCDTLKLPFHWVVGYSPEILVLGKCPYTERFMDDFIRLPARQREYFEQVVMDMPAFLHKNSIIKQTGGAEN